MSGKKCKHCGSSDIEVDPARGDAVCTNCGSVLEDNIIVSEVEFQENAHGGSSAIGQFVSAESKGGASGFGRAYVGIGQESREITLRKARESITALCQQLRLNQQCIDIACNFFKMALSRHLTIGRPANLTQAACVYMTCRTEGTAHLLIDISDALQICCYQLGRTYFKLSRKLCINIPPTDPCLYILRFASQLQFEVKQHDVSMTALRLVQRMKRDSIHSGRRPSGICGAALLIAARLHDFSRTPLDVVRIVKVHESTLRKRLLEFGETPSSALTLDEFMTVDLEEEQDPPAFKAARKKDKERLQRLMEEEDGEKEITELQKEIESQLDRDNSRRRKAATTSTISPVSIEEVSTEDVEASRFAAEDTLDLLGKLARETDGVTGDRTQNKIRFEKGLGPDLAVIGLGQPEEKDKFLKPEPKSQFSKDLQQEELQLSERDEEYVSSLIMSEEESRLKSRLWNNVNAGYLKEQKIKEEIRAKEKEEGKKKKVRGSYKKKVALNAATAGEAIEKMLAEKKMSSKINYDILKSLDQPGSLVTSTTVPATPTVPTTPNIPVTPTVLTTPSRTLTVHESKLATPKETVAPSPVPRKRKKKEKGGALPTPSPKHAPPASSPKPASHTPKPATETETADDYDEDEPEVPDVSSEMSLAAMLQNGDDDDYYGYDEY